MFVQIIEGRVIAAAAHRTQFDHWAAELGVHTPVVPDAGPIQVPALGWIGTTAGISEADEFIAVVRFESEAAARLSNDRPEQGEWWAETARHFEGDVIVHDCADVDILLDGGSDDAGSSRLRKITPTMSIACEPSTPTWSHGGEPTVRM